MPKYDITQSNVGIDKLLAVTTNPRHRYILMAYARHRFLEFSGRYDEVLGPDMMVDNPVYNLHALGFNTTITGKDQDVPVILSVQSPRQARLPVVGHTLDTLGLQFGFCQRREQHRREDGDDRNDHQQFD